MSALIPLGRHTDTGLGMEFLFVFYPLSLLFIGVGGYFSIRNLRRILKVRSMVDWPKTAATITVCEVKNENHSKNSLPKVLVKYEYKVRGHKYENDKIHPTLPSLEWVCKYRRLYDCLERSTVVMARYNPSDPSESYLVSGSFHDHRSDLFGGLVFLIFGIFFLSCTYFFFIGNADYATALEVIK